MSACCLQYATDDERSDIIEDLIEEFASAECDAANSIVKMVTDSVSHACERSVAIGFQSSQALSACLESAQAVSGKEVMVRCML